MRPSFLPSILIIGVSLLISDAAAATSDTSYHFELFAGRPEGKWTYHDMGSEAKDSLMLTGEEMGFAFHYSLENLPCSVGLLYRQESFTPSQLTEAELNHLMQRFIPEGSDLDRAQTSLQISRQSKLTGQFFGPDFKIWLKTPLYQPYLHLSFMGGQYHLTTAAHGQTPLPVMPSVNLGYSNDQLFSAQSVAAALGMMVRPLTSVAFSVEYAYTEASLSRSQSRGSFSLSHGSRQMSRYSWQKSQYHINSETFQTQELRFGLIVSL
jgi:hypothetical protein